MRCIQCDVRQILKLATVLFLLFLLMSTLSLAKSKDRPEQAMAPEAYDAGVMRFEVVDEGRPFDPLHGITVGPRILVGVVFYPIEKGSGGDTPITQSYYHDGAAAYARTVEWGFKYSDYSGNCPNWPLSADEILGCVGQSVAGHLSSESEGTYAGGVKAEGPFPIIIQFNGAGGRGHQADVIGAAFARRGYIYVGLDAPGVSSLSPVGRGGLDSHADLKVALEGLPSCADISTWTAFPPPICFTSEHGEYGTADDGQIIWGSPYLWETYVVQRGDEYAAYGIAPTSFPVNMVGEEFFGYAFGSQIGAILCETDAGCDPLVAARQFDFPVGVHTQEEDWLITGFPYNDGSAEWAFWIHFPGYGDGLTPAPSPENRSPANRIIFESVAEGVPTHWTQLPDAGHINYISNPLMRYFDDVVLLPVRVFTFDFYTPLPMGLQQEIVVHYAAAFLDLTVKGRRGSLGALKTDRYDYVTPDGRGVTTMGRSLEVRLDK
jgi:hypothetical protein